QTLRVSITQPGVAQSIFDRRVRVERPGWVAIALPSNTAGLFEETTYDLTFGLICNPNKPSESAYRRIEIEKVPLPASVRSQLELAQTESEKVKLLLSAGIWYDAIAASYQAALTQSSQAERNFQALLERVNNRIKALWHNWHGALAVSVGITALVLGVRYVGGFQKEELAWLDRFFRWRPVEVTDERIVIVGITETDIKNYPPYPFTDKLLAQLLNRLKAQKPRVIGLDIIRNVANPPAEKDLTEVFLSTPNLIGVGKLTQTRGDNFFTQIPFPSILEQKGQIADLSGIEDEDGITRRDFSTRKIRN
ncbi:MAG: CHASE2 domain-containing protein, partial [Microcystaceae cyanobacterium]